MKLIEDIGFDHSFGTAHRAFHDLRFQEYLISIVLGRRRDDRRGGAKGAAVRLSQGA